MNNGPVNSLSFDLIEELEEALSKAGQDKDCAGVILASDCRAFSAGLDMNELHGANTDHLTKFWTKMQDLVYLLYNIPQAVVCEIGGHAPAAGTILALCCDSRVAAPKVVMGLNESAFGLNVPLFGIALMQDVIGIKAADRAISLGTLYTSEEAQELGFVDIVTDSADTSLVKEAALLECEKWVVVPGRRGNKHNLRQKKYDKFIAERDIDLKNFITLLTSSITQKRLGEYLASLSNKNRSK